jgi:two-component system sensor histidine kinase KdpD
VEIHVPADLEVWADNAFAQKVIANLLENAGKYSPAGSPILVTAERQNGMVAISVADRGMGIDASEQTLIFERFYRVDSHNSRTSGTGMGLPISRAIVEAHGGTIKVTSQPGQGSVFTVTLRTSAF